ncbi:septum site-determining protein MinC [Buchnera aphidicola (Neophyllaphis podocarpi)]|uniref:septum site-determining protein MinC n=1 Tax=Buchnera aphidicola TaxID=9 RepID=UPI0031B84408
MKDFEKKISQNYFLKTLILDYPIRSGQQIYSNNSDLVINNHVNYGAELISDGNVHIYGKVRGKVLAGVKGDKNSQIFCSNFNPELIAISGEYMLTDQIPKKFLGKSVNVTLRDDTLCIKLLK